MTKMIQAEPWKIISRSKSVDNQRPQGAKKGMGGGDNPARTSRNVNPSGDYKMPAHLKGDRLNRSGNAKMGGQVPDIAGHPANKGRNPRGDDKTPKIKRIKPKNSYRQK